MSDIREQVRERYALAATQTATDGCCGGSCGAAEPIDERFGEALYDAQDLVGLPDEARLASLGCGNPLAVAELRAGERVLDLGSGGGIDVLLSARRVGSTGFAYGVDMTDEMLALARSNAEKAGAANVEFRKGTIEDLPFDDASVDVVISNCVVNLSPDKTAVLSEVFRVLTPGGRVGISDVVAEDRLSPEQRAERGSYVGCIAGALSRTEYLDGLAAAGFADAEVTFTHEVADGMHGAVVRARKPQEH
ncbi:arsenite methyltransferase [Cellulomonas biazotea]|uniref:Arsenite methyltransferase n=1 Tax=Cellulomonas biazotea TaxID=1709 RepID=A0A402DSE1_9CELL|nr:arsenite methyltransferase [Cellulomonas biazotea]GCE77037.1 arsenite S-adenosylmethyltransferase [Cellulomonas biazotea]